MYRNRGSIYRNRWNNTSNKNPILEGEFKYGRYRYNGADPRISECTDIDYLMWYYKDDDKNPHALKRVLELSDELTEYEGSIITKAEKKSRESVKNNIDIFKELNLAIITFKKNPNRDGIIDHFGMKLKFKDVEYRNYNGYDYYVPRFDGKAKLIKNKTFKVFATPREIEEGTIFDIKKLTRVKL